MLSSTMNQTGVAGALAMSAQVDALAGSPERTPSAALGTIPTPGIVTGSPAFGRITGDVPTFELVRPGGAPG